MNATFLRRLSSWILIGGALLLSIGPLMLAPQPRAITPTAADTTPLPKACWPPSTLLGKDTVYLYLPCSDLRMVDSATRAQIQCTLDRMRDHAHMPARANETYRSDWRQLRLYLQGRPWLPGGRVGVIVTNAKSANLSAHGSGHGADIISVKYGWSNARFFELLRHHAFTCGLEAGGSWVKFPDPPHVQNRTWTAARTRMAALSPP